MPDNLSSILIEKLRERKETVAIAESCTGGMVLGALTDIRGSSAAVWGGVVAYSNEAKVKLLHVNPSVLNTDGAVSENAAKAMAKGMKECSGAEWSLSVTGIAGPDGAVPGKPVGTLCFAWCSPEGVTETQRKQFDGTRQSVRLSAVETALKGLLVRLDKKKESSS